MTFSVDQDVVDLVDSGAMRRLPCGFVNVFSGKDGAADYTVVV